MVFQIFLKNFEIKIIANKVKKIFAIIKKPCYNYKTNQKGDLIMLVIKRKSGQGFIIESKEGEIIEVNVMIDEINSRDIKVSIEAPQDFTILRNELLEFEKVSEDIRKSILCE